MKDFKLKNYGLIGKSLNHSMSEYIHSVLWNYDYKLQNLSSSEFENFFKKKDFKGLNVTIPYKIEVIKYLDSLSDLAKQIGSVNTIVNKNNMLIGYNTDYFGFDYMVKKADISYENKNILILGSGGASKMVFKYLEDVGAKNIVVISRTGDNNYKSIYNFKNYDGIINTTPVGMYPNNLDRIIDLSKFENLESVVDLIYNPLMTGLILDAKKIKIKYATGLDMLVAQAFYSSEIFFERELNKNIIDSTVNILRNKMRNIVFVGMPGAGKTTIANLISKEINYDFIDIDEEIVKFEKISVADIFKIKGESYFRKLESKILEKYTKEGGRVISTGGGSILKKENRDMIMQNGFVICLNRKINKLEKSERPLSKDISSLEKIYKERKDIYRDISNIEIEVDDDVRVTLKRVKKELLKNEIISN